MGTRLLLSVFTWTFRGILCTCRFLWICPYNAIQFLPRKKSCPAETRRQPRPNTVSERRPSIPGSPEHGGALQRRLAKTERDVLSLKTRICCQRASWEMRFNELQRRQEELCMQLRSEVRLCVRGDPTTECPGSESGELSSGPSNHLELIESCTSPLCPSSQWDDPCSCSTPSGSRARSLCSSNLREGSWRSPRSGRRCLAPRSLTDLRLGQRVRVMLPSGRVGTGTLRYLGPLRGEPGPRLGVELTSPDYSARQDGSHGGQRYFQCEPGYGAFVPFSKLLMAWE